MSNPRIDEGGTKWWYKDNKLHRENGPAIEWDDGDKYWFINGELHRIDGPAAEIIDGTKRWYINDKEYTKKQYFKKVSELVSKEELFLLRLKYE